MGSTLDADGSNFIRPIAASRLGAVSRSFHFFNRRSKKNGILVTLGAHPRIKSVTKGEIHQCQALNSCTTSNLVRNARQTYSIAIYNLNTRHPTMTVNSWHQAYHHIRHGQHCSIPTVVMTIPPLYDYVDCIHSFSSSLFIDTDQPA